MTKLAKYQKLYPDTMSVEFTSKAGISLRDIQQCAESCRTGSIILEGSVKGNKAKIFFSADAKNQGVSPGDVIFG